MYTPENYSAELIARIDKSELWTIRRECMKQLSVSPEYNPPSHFARWREFLEMIDREIRLRNQQQPTVQIGLFGEDKALRKAKRPAAQQLDMFAGQWDFGKTARPVDKDWKGKLGLSMQDNPNDDDKPAPGQQSFI